MAYYDWCLETHCITLLRLSFLLKWKTCKFFLNFEARGCTTKMFALANICQRNHLGANSFPFPSYATYVSTSTQWLPLNSDIQVVLRRIP